MRKTENKLSNTIATFLLSMAIVPCFIVLALYIYTLSSGSILETLVKSDYYDGLQKSLLENAGDFLIPTGLSEKILDGVFPKEDVEEMINRQIQGTESEESIQIIETKNRTRLEDNIDSYLEEIGVTKDEVSEGELDNIINALIDDFKDYASFPLATQLLRLRDLYKMMMWIVLGTCFFLGAGMTFFLYKTNRWKHIFLRYVAYSFGGVSLMLILFPLIIRIVRAYERIGISPQYVYHFCVQHIQKSLNSLIGFGIVAFVCMLALGSLSEKARKKLVARQSGSAKIAQSSEAEAN